METTNIVPFFVSTTNLSLSTTKLVADLLKTLPSPRRWRPLFSLPPDESLVMPQEKKSPEEITEEDIGRTQQDYIELLKLLVTLFAN